MEDSAKPPNENPSNSLVEEMSSLSIAPPAFTFGSSSNPSSPSVQAPSSPFKFSATPPSSLGTHTFGAPRGLGQTDPPEPTSPSSPFSFPAFTGNPPDLSPTSPTKPPSSNPSSSPTFSETICRSTLFFKPEQLAPPGHEKKKRNDTDKIEKLRSRPETKWPTTFKGAVPQPTPLDRYKSELRAGVHSLRATMCDGDLTALIAASTSLTKLDICAKISEANVVEIAKNTSIKNLNLMSCGLSDQAVAHLVTSTSLLSLNLSCNHLSDATLQPLLNNTHLNTLRFDSCTALNGAIDDPSIANNTSLRRLSLARNPLKGVLTHLPINITHLSLEAADISDPSALIHIAQLSRLVHLGISFIPHPLELIAALMKHPVLESLNMDVIKSTPLCPEAARLISANTNIAYLTLNNYLISDTSAEYLARSEAIAHLEAQNSSLSVAGLASIFSIPYLRYLDISGVECPAGSLDPLASNTSIRRLYINRSRINDPSPLHRNTTLRDLCMANGQGLNNNCTQPLAQCTNLRYLNVSGNYGSLLPQPWCQNTTLLRLSHSQFDLSGDSFQYLGEHDRIRGEVCARHAAALQSFLGCCLVLGRERLRPWEDRSLFGKLPLELIAIIMEHFDALWARAPDSRGACAAFLVTQGRKLKEIAAKRLPIVVYERSRPRGKIGFKLFREKSEHTA